MDLKLNRLYQSYRYTIPLPGGAKANIFLTEDDDGQPHTVIYNIGKAGSDVSAWCNAVGRLTSFALQNTSLDEVIGELSDIATDRFIELNDKDKTICRSGPEALAIALRYYRDMKLLTLER